MGSVADSLSAHAFIGDYFVPERKASRMFAGTLKNLAGALRLFFASTCLRQADTYTPPEPPLPRR